MSTRRLAPLGGLAGALIVGLSALWPAATPASAPAIDAVVKDEKGKPVEDAVAYVVPAAPAGALPGTAVMDQWQQEFIPHVLPVEVGTAVSFPNRDNIRHHVYSVSPAKKFELPLYIGTPAAPVLFDKPGPVVLGCNIHDWMVAYVYVLPTPHFARTGDKGVARIERVRPGTHEVRVWHPRLKVDTETTGQRVTVGGAPVEVTFTVGLKREWRKPRPAGGRYDPSQQGN
jgi:plastocyanin